MESDLKRTGQAEQRECMKLIGCSCLMVLITHNQTHNKDYS